MGSKGSQTSQTSQNQSYVPTGGNYITNALNTAQNAAQLPFNLPQAPVAGFGALQNQGFGQIAGAANAAQPFFGQAQNYFNQAATPNVNQFLNPYASAVTSQLNNIFGQQASQNTGQLTQAAGGVGADRIAVGQANLANQQGLAAGQTLAGLYAPSLQAAQNEQGILQGLGSNTANLGLQQQQAGLQGGQSLLNAGQLQQNLQQQQLNAPYQQQVAQSLFPYQQSQFLSGAVGALAPGLGGTTSGTGTTTSQYNPSLWGQIGGGLQALSGPLGYLSGSGGKGSGGGNYATQPLTGQDAYYNQQLFPGYGTAARGGAVFADGGGVSDQPIDVSQAGKIPTAQIPHIAAQIPHLNLTPPAPSQQSGGGGGLGDALKAAASIASMFGSGGAVGNPFDGINASHDRRMRNIFERQNPYADGGEVTMEDRFAPTREAIASGAFDPQGADFTDFAGSPGMVASNRGEIPSPAARPDSAGPPVMASDDEADTTEAVKPTSPVAGKPTNNVSSFASPQADTGPSLAGFLQSPWAALTAGGLDAMRTGSLASGFGTTMKLAQGQETAKQAADRLAQEAKFHQDEMDKAPVGYEYTDDNTMRAIPGGPADPAVMTAAAKAKMSSGMLSPEALDLMAKTYIRTGQVPQLGYGNAGTANRVQFWNAVQPMMEAEGWTPDDIVAAKADVLSQNTATKAFGTGRQGDTIRSFDVATQHLNLLQNLVTALDNKDVQAINRLGNAVASATGQTAPTNFEAARHIVADEIVKAVVGSKGALGDRESAAAAINGAMSPQQLMGVINTYKGLMSGQLLGLKKQYEDTTHKKDFLERISPETKQALLGHATQQAGHTIVRQGTVNSGPNAGKRVIEYSDGTRVFQ